MSDESGEIRRAHDLVRHFEHHEESLAAEEFATHIRKFWEPRMRAELVRQVGPEAEGAPPQDGEGVDPRILAGVRAYLRGEVDRAEVAEPSGG
ncbi:formate dehydrogenase subunit delta [Actinomycetota bacterium]